MIGITILGSTGSIGENTLDVISRHREKFRVFALTAGTNTAKLTEQCRAWEPRYAVVADESQAGVLAEGLDAAGLDTEVLAGTAGLERVASHEDTDYVMAAIVGAAGLLPTLAAARAGKRVLLANKEALVMSGRLFIDAIRESGGELLPIDSEHNAIFQCMPPNFRDGLRHAGVQRILLTASGGPFRTTPLEELDNMTPDQACAHPNWDMGRKISVDSATMMNKGLELIEASWLFNTSVDSVEVVLHPQSVIHSMVEFVDGSVLAQLGNPDMRTPIAHALAWPERMSSGVPVLDMFKVARLDFSPPDTGRFPCLRLAREAAGEGGTASAILNAANEVAVQAFLEKRIRFTGIARIVEETLASVTAHAPDSLEIILSDDAAAREHATAAIQRIAA